MTGTEAALDELSSYCDMAVRHSYDQYEKHGTLLSKAVVAFRDDTVWDEKWVPDDFDVWLPREKWRAADTVLFVTDTRYPTDGASELPLLSRYSQSKVRTIRGGRSARIFELYLYARRGQAAL